MLREVFLSRHRKLLWPAFTYYVQPILPYCTSAQIHFLNVCCSSRARSTQLHETILSVCLIKTDFIDSMLCHLLYNMRLYPDMVTVFKYLRSHVNCSPADASLEITTAHSRAGGVRLRQRWVVGRVTTNMFSHRAASA